MASEAGGLMKRWIFFLVALLVLAASTYFYLPYLVADDAQFYRFIFFVASLTLAFSASYLVLNIQHYKKVLTLQNRLSMWTKLSYHVNQVGDEIFNELPIGMIAIADNGEIKWVNPQAKTIFDVKITGKNLKDVHPDLYQAVLKSTMNLTIQVGTEFYDVTYRQEYNFFYLFNVTEREIINTRYRNRIPVLAILNLDNLDEALSSLDVSEQSSVKGDYLGVIADWASTYDAYIKPYSDERIVLVTSREKLILMIDDKFDILDKIRKISQRTHIRVSLSIGIASWDVSHEELGVYAQNAIELAEKRGGDQVVVNIQNQKIAYFGGKNDAQAKSSKIGARINAHTIKDFIGRASNVLIMGHDQADLDAFGSMLAVYHMAGVSKKQVRMIIDEDKLDRTVQHVYERIKEEMKERFVTSDQALKLINSDTLLIVCDTQSPKVVMDQEILKKVKQLIVIDHHRVNEEGFDSIFSYIEPYASSTIELVMELLNFYNMEDEIRISEFEATIMYSGLIVDTNNFTFRTNARTFEVAARLKELGADIFEVKTWLRKDLKRTLAINKLLNKIEIYLDRFAFVVTHELHKDRILLAQVAEEALAIDGVQAAFAIAKAKEDTVGVSARSYSSVNVQVLMEALGGGGHLNSAAAQVEGSTVKQVYKTIKNHIESEYGGGGEPMKIILLEDVKGKGKKNEIIEVANGYANFLVRQKKAMLANDENVEAIEKAKLEAEEKAKRHIEMMKKLKSEIDNKKVVVGIQIGVDGKLFGSVTTKQICEAFEQEHGILLDRKKVELESEINSVGIYTATVNLHKDIKAQFEVHIVEK
jgi:cyclic-di-AMP phosphodiesterase